MLASNRCMNSHPSLRSSSLVILFIWRHVSQAVACHASNHFSLVKVLQVFLRSKIKPSHPPSYISLSRLVITLYIGDHNCSKVLLVVYYLFVSSCYKMCIFDSLINKFKGGELLLHSFSPVLKPHQGGDICYSGLG